MTTYEPREITREYLLELFDYDRAVGKLFWKIPKANRIKIGDEAGYIRKDGYHAISIDNKECLTHRLIWMIETGKWPENDIDHIDGQPSNNRIQNLQDVTHRQNGRNQKLPHNNSSGVVGVSWYKRYQKWVVQSRKDGKNINLGYFENKRDAANTILEFYRTNDFSERHQKSVLDYLNSFKS
jgi:hypothetical protein